MPITINGSGTITGASTLSTTVASPTFITPNIDSAQFATVTGTAPLYAARAWVNFNGTGTVAIRASGNISSITDNGTGDYTVNFTTAMSDANYSAVVGCSSDDLTPMMFYERGTFSTARSASFLKVATASNAGVFVDRTSVDVTIFR